MKPLTGTAALVFAATTCAAEPGSIARFSSDAGVLDLAHSDIAEAQPWFDEGAAGINIALDSARAEALADLTRRSVGQSMAFSVCGNTLVTATVRTAIEGGRIAAVTDGLGTATWYAQILRGKVGCDGKRVE